MRIAISVGRGNAVIGGVFVAAASLFAVDAPAFESQIWPGSLPALSASVGVKSSVRVEGSAYVAEGWVLINYAMPVDCSPPRACYTSLQHVHAYANCSTGVIRELKRISLDLNGNVVAETGGREAYLPARGSVDGEVVYALCFEPGVEIRRPR